MLLRELRKRQPRLPGIVVSGHGLDSDIERTRSAGFAEHLTKPVSVDALKRAFARLLGN
jgi:CheY-like chemotaxis protein